jgi:hypothetical protein
MKGLVVLHVILSERMEHFRDEMSSNVPSDTGQNTSSFSGVEPALVRTITSCSIVLH